MTRPGGPLTCLPGGASRPPAWPKGSPTTVCSLWLQPHQLTRAWLGDWLGDWLRDCPDRFAGFLFTASCFPGHCGSFLPLPLSLFLSGSISSQILSLLLSSLLSPSPCIVPAKPQAEGPGPQTSLPLPCPRLGAPVLPWAACLASQALTQKVSIFFNGYKIIDNYRNGNANNSKSHVLGPNRHIWAYFLSLIPHTRPVRSKLLSCPVSR